MEMREWLIIIVFIVLILTILDGFRRKWMERRRSLKFKLDKNIPDEKEGYDYDRNNELPNGGARLAQDAPFYGRNEDEFSDEQGSSGFEGEGDEFNDDVPTLVDEVELVNEPDETEEDIDDVLMNGVHSRLAEDEFTGSREEFLNDEGLPKELEDAQLDEENINEAIDDAINEVKEDSPSEYEAEIYSDERKEPSFGDNFDERAYESVISAPKPIAYTKEDQAELFKDPSESYVGDVAPKTEEPQEVIVFNVMSKPGETFHGEDLLPILLQQGMRLGDMSIFHRHGDTSGNGPVMFSMANMVEPGTFDLSKMEGFTTPGISFFLQMPNSLGNMKCFEKMLLAASAVKDGLNGDLKDEARNIMTRQTLDHCRERVQDFELKQLSARSSK